MPCCIESILAQTHTDLQIILVNDGSTDGSLKVCNYYASIDSRIRVIDKQNGGVSAARNCGIRVAEGDYIGFVDSDDYIEKSMFQVLLNRIIDDNSQLCAMTSYTVNKLGGDETVDRVLSGQEALKRFLLLRFPTSLWAFLYSRDAIEGCYLRRDIHFFEDFEFNYRVLSRVTKVSTCALPLYHYRARDGSANSSAIGDRRVSCLRVSSYVRADLQKRRPELLPYAAYSGAHFLISVIVGLLRTLDADTRYYDLVQEEARKMRWNAILSAYVPIRFKLAILACSLNPRLALKALRLVDRRA